MITQQPGTDKPGFENADGELPLIIENDFIDHSIMNDQAGNNPNTTS